MASMLPLPCLYLLVPGSDLPDWDKPSEFSLMAPINAEGDVGPRKLSLHFPFKTLETGRTPLAEPMQSWQQVPFALTL